jgi:hypothetical protein
MERTALWEPPLFWTVDPTMVDEGALFDAVQGKSHQLGIISERIGQLPRGDT